MNVFLCTVILIIAALDIYIGIRLELLAQSVDNVEHNANLLMSEAPSRSWFSTAKTDIDTRLNVLEDTLTTEIACLATKNNEDIKRMGGKFEEWDLIELDENEVLIYSAKPNANGQMVFHCVDKAGKMYTFFGSDKLNDAKFLRHTSSPFDEREV